MRRRNKEIVLWFTEDEYSSLKKQVGKTGLSMQAYFRLLIRQIQPKEKPPPDVIDILKNLQQINNNMNQIAMKANSNGFVDTASYWQNVRWLQETVSKLMEVIYT